MNLLLWIGGVFVTIAVACAVLWRRDLKKPRPSPTLPTLAELQRRKGTR